MRRLLLLVVVCVTACGDNVSVDEASCTTLRDHLVDLRVAEAGNVEGLDVAQHRAAMKQALGDEFVGHCVQTMTVAQLKCSLKSSRLDDLARCRDGASQSGSR